eukprot:gene9746-13113_t
MLNFLFFLLLFIVTLTDSYLLNRHYRNFKYEICYSREPQLIQTLANWLDEFKTLTSSAFPVNIVLDSDVSSPTMIESIPHSTTSLPPKREFVPVNYYNKTKIEKTTFVHSQLRVFQFNMLADGLSGLRSDLGAFSRAKPSFMGWNSRKSQLLYEILQYNPDIITLQECDHFYDFFLPELNAMGYDGIFAPKPASACLEVSDNSDGCAMFHKRDKLRLISTETMTYTLSKSDLNVNQGDEDKLSDKQRQESSSVRSRELTLTPVRAQNQVALVAVFEQIKAHTDDLKKFYTENNMNIEDMNLSTPKIIVATTHLKAAKTQLGERYRRVESEQLLRAVERCKKTFSQPNSQEFSNGKKQHIIPPAIIITGDFNACPTAKSSQFGYDSSVYPFLKSHSLGLRSVLNDDLFEALSHQKQFSDENDLFPSVALDQDSEIWTTWKARRKKGKEFVVKHCIDYIFYGTLLYNKLLKDQDPSERNIGIRAKSVLSLLDQELVGESLLPSESYPSDHLSVVADLQIVEQL